MKWKTKEIENAWVKRKNKGTPIKLYLVLTLLDEFRLKYENKHITITSFIRDISVSSGRPSFHPPGRAADTRKRDMSKEALHVIGAFLETLIGLLNDIYPGSTLQAVIEKDHIHIEDDDGNPAFPKT